MRKPEQTSEPSIEEILASIRRIIADDGAPPSPSAPGPARSQAAPAPQRRFTSAAEDDDWTSDNRDPYAEPAEPSELASDDEILELTEDFMVEDRAMQDRHGPAAEHDPTVGEMTEAFAAGGGDISEAEFADPRHGIESVLSSVAAEVERLSSGKHAGPRGEAAVSVENWADDVGSSPAAPMTPPAAKRETKAPPAAQSAPAPARPVAPAHRPAPKPAASRPVWSARHLESDAPRGRGMRPAAENSPARTEPPARPKGIAERDSWAEGIQMPVPESGPAAPPFARDGDEDIDATPPLSGSGEARAEIEEEKTFVGEMLTRVFGNTAKQDEQAAPSEPDGPKAKAEMLARSAVSDFASDKLRAPAVADALHADKPFMEVITDSLETALAKAGAAEEKVAGTPRSEAPAAVSEELPEPPPPPDTEAEAFAAPRGRPGAAANAASADAAPKTAPSSAEQNSASLFGEPDEVPAPQAFYPAPDFQPAAKVAAQSAAPKPAAPQPLAPQAGGQAPLSLAAALSGGLEDAIKELIKPLIVQWLNDNLPRIVEKAVREEIAEQRLVSPQRDGVRR